MVRNCRTKGGRIGRIELSFQDRDRVFNICWVGGERVDTGGENEAGSRSVAFSKDSPDPLSVDVIGLGFL